MSEGARTIRTEIRKVFRDTENRSGKKYKSPRYSASTAEGDRFSTFDPEVGRLLQESEGKVVELQLERNGEYENIVGVIPSAGGSSNGATLKPRDPTESRHIARQAAMKAAAQFYAGGTHHPNDLFSLADRMVAWVYGEDAVQRIVAPTTEEIAADRAERYPQSPVNVAYPGDEALIALFNSNAMLAASFLTTNKYPFSIENMNDRQKGNLWAYLSEHGKS